MNFFQMLSSPPVLMALPMVPGGTPFLSSHSRERDREKRKALQKHELNYSSSQGVKMKNAFFLISSPVALGMGDGISTPYMSNMTAL